MFLNTLIWAMAGVITILPSILNPLRQRPQRDEQRQQRVPPLR
jgi:hypothetical protein